MRETFKGLRNGSGNTDDFYVVAVFRTYEQCEAFLEKVGLPNNRYQSGEEIATKMGVDLAG